MSERSVSENRKLWEAAEKAAAETKEADGPSTADKVRRAVRKTYVTKHVVDLFIKNMTENDQKNEN